MIPTYSCLLCGTTTPFPHYCPQFRSSGGVKQITLEQFKLVCIDDTFSDAEVEKIAGIVVLESKEDVEDFCNILHKYRPEVEKSLNYEISEKRTRTTAF